MELWTLGELAERVEVALADYPGQVNGRVRAVPDQRTIRWYTTTGLVDRPAEMRGRTALYGRRHLLQLVAIKRRQSQGQTIAQIQSELAGATNQTLEPIASLPNPFPPNPFPPNPSHPAHAPGSPGGVSDAMLEPGESSVAGGAALPRARFWADRSPEPSPAEAAPRNVPRPTNASGGVPARDLLSAESAEADAIPGETPRLATDSTRDLFPATSGAMAAEVAVVTAVRIADGVTVVLDQGGAVPDAERLAAAAGPFLAELRRQGLLTQSSGDES